MVSGGTSFIHGYTSSRYAGDGFTVAELVLVITVIGILAGVSYLNLHAILPTSRDNNRQLDTSIIMDKLESYYETDPIAGGYTYPDTSVGPSGLAAIVNSQDSVEAPGQSGNSLVMATSNASQVPTTNQYIYQPLTRSGGLCTQASTSLCARYILYYRSEMSGNVIVLNSLRQQ